MTDADEKRGPGRPRKESADDEMAAIKTATDVAKNMVIAESAFPEPEKPKFAGDTVGGEPLMEVQLLKNYAPIWIEDDAGEMIKQAGVFKKLAAGETIRLPKTEAARALKLGIAQVTEHTFA